MKKKNKDAKKGLFNDRRVALLVALILAVVSWVIVAGFINPGNTRTLQYVKIDYTRNEESYKSKNLKIVGDYPYTFADVEVRGDGSVTGPLSNTSVEVYPDYSTVTGPGQQEIRLLYQKVDQGDYTISALSVRGNGRSLGSNPAQTITLTFEQLDSKTLPVTVDAEGIQVAEGFFPDTPIAVPSEITINGPKTEVDRVAGIEAAVTDEEPLNERKIYQGIAYTLLDANGNELDKEGLSLTYSVETVDVDVPILEIRDIGLAVRFSGLPSYYDTEWLYERIQLSADTLQVVGSAAAFDQIDDPLVVSTVPASELGPNWESDPINITLPEGSGLRNHDELRQITAALDTTGMAEKTFEISGDNITVVNGPRSATITSVAETVSVKLFGPEDQIEALLPEQITLQIEAFGVTATQAGQQSLPGRVLAPSANRCIALGSYAVVCDITLS